MVNGLIAENRAGTGAELITTKGPGDAAADGPVRQLAEAGVPVRRFRRFGPADRAEAWGLSPGLVLWLARNIRRYDVVHLQYVWCLTSIVGSVVARLAGVPVVMTPHESLTEFDTEVASRHPILKQLKKILRHLFLVSVDQLFLMSELERRDTATGSIPVRVVSHAVLEEAVAGDETSESPGPVDRDLRIAFLGRNIEKKGIHLILEAIAMDPEGRVLTIAGPASDPDYRELLEELIDRHDLKDRVRWHGFVEDRPAYLREADVLAMPSVYEGFGMVAAEAMCVGVPVIVPERSGVAEIVAEFDAGLVLPDVAPSSLHEAFSRISDDPGLKVEMQRNAIRAVNERLTFRAYARSTGEAYRRLTARP